MTTCLFIYIYKLKKKALFLRIQKLGGIDKNKIINSKRQPRNLKRLLCTSRYDSKEQLPCITKCMIPRCGTYNDIVECNTYVFKNGFRFKIKSNMNCRSKHIIYALICKHCSEFYIGQTGCEMRQRMTVQRQQIRTDHLRFLPISKHIHQCSNFRHGATGIERNINKIIDTGT